MRLRHNSGHLFLILPNSILITGVVTLSLLTCEKFDRTNPNDPLFILEPPSDLMATPISNSEIELTWTDHTVYETGFRIERDAGSGFDQIAEVNTDVTSYTDGGLTPGSSYTYRVRAFNAGNNSDYSAPVTTSFCMSCVVDIDGNIYQTIQIGDQEWMAENLKVTHYRNGESIPTGYSNTGWASLSTGAYSKYNDDDVNAETYGLLYNWFAVNDPRGLAPIGWHVAADSDWKQLENFLGMSQNDVDGTMWRGSNEGGQLADRVDLWYDGILNSSPVFGVSGFSAIPGGYRGDINEGMYAFLGYYAYFWTATEYDGEHAWHRHLRYDRLQVDRNTNRKKIGFSARCVRD